MKKLCDLYYVRFHQAVPPAENKEPVNEFTLVNKHAKYVVESMILTEQGVLWKAYGETNFTPLANIIYSRVKIHLQSNARAKTSSSIDHGH